MTVSDIVIAKRSDRSAASIRLAPRSSVGELVDFNDVPDAVWRDLAERAVEPNLFYEPTWLRAVARHANGYGGAKALLAWDSPRKQRLIGLLPVTTAWRSKKLPVPVLIAWQPYVPLRTPLLDESMPEKAAHGLIEAAIEAGAKALLLPQQKMRGHAMQALSRALEQRGLHPAVRELRERAGLNAVADAETLLRVSLGAKRAKELRRQRNRLADHGELSFAVAALPHEVAPALERFLALEASGWKGRRCTALVQNDGDAAFIREAAAGLAKRGQVEVLALHAGDRLVASCVVLRNRKTAFFFKLAHDESEAKNSPGVQLTLDLTRHLCADPSIVGVDSTADANHPMIDHIWRERILLGDVFVPLSQNKLQTGAISMALCTHDALRNRARAVVHRLRAIREKRK